MMLVRPFRGRNRGGMLSHVLRPMMTALVGVDGALLLVVVGAEGGGRLVTRAK